MDSTINAKALSCLPTNILNLSQGTDPTDKVQHTHKGHDCVSDVENQALYQIAVPSK